jgi:hypothetical protein
MSIVLGLLFAASSLQPAATAGSPESVVLSAVAKVAGGCIDPQLHSSELLKKFHNFEDALRIWESSGQLKWVNGQAEWSGQLKEEMERAPAGDRAQLTGSRDDIFAAHLQWFITIPSKPNNIEPIADEASRTISHAAAKAVQSAKDSDGTVDLSRLPDTLKPRLHDDGGCRYQVNISQVLYWGSWAFVTTGAQWAPMAGEGKTWALNRDGGFWRIVAFTRDWVS